MMTKATGTTSGITTGSTSVTTTTTTAIQIPIKEMKCESSSLYTIATDERTTNREVLRVHIPRGALYSELCCRNCLVLPVPIYHILCSSQQKPEALNGAACRPSPILSDDAYYDICRTLNGHLRQCDVLRTRVVNTFSTLKT
jgi:hypothetical protein